MKRFYSTSTFCGAARQCSSMARKRRPRAGLTAQLQTVEGLLADLRELEPVVNRLAPGDQESRGMIVARLKDRKGVGEGRRVSVVLVTVSARINKKKKIT